ncbi:alpha/beta hydrolase [Ktedonobacteria bacterium brp13]|nr:alpha/beta hydrolase [Ktedonobacteria bacterium brp13]
MVAPDLRGYNDTDKPSRGYDVPTLLRDIVGLIKGLGYEKAIIIGHDWGGALAWFFAITYPQLTERLVVLNAPHPDAMQRELKTWKQLRKSWYIFALQIPWLPEYLLGRNHATLIAQIIHRVAFQKAAFPTEVLDHYREAIQKPGALHASINYYHSLFRSSLSPASAKKVDKQIIAPTLLIWGEQDVVLNIELTKDLEQWVPNILVKRIPDTAWWSYDGVMKMRYDHWLALWLVISKNKATSSTIPD